ncbi:MAG: hypothetical protein KDC56_08035, partial [Flavobacteriaceae bacterium]|nr:hypothetical protein [Flavobacteriaceae bacterium]
DLSKGEVKVETLGQNPKEFLQIKAHPDPPDWREINQNKKRTKLCALNLLNFSSLQVDRGA